MIGEGSVGPEFTTMFTMFINNKLDKIISPDTIMNHESEEYILNTLKGVIGKEDKYINYPFFDYSPAPILGLPAYHVARAGSVNPSSNDINSPPRA